LEVFGALFEELEMISTLEDRFRREMKTKTKTKRRRDEND